MMKRPPVFYKINTHAKASGFSVMETVVSIGIFSVVMTAMVSVLVSSFRAETKAANVRAVTENLRFTLELMTRELRTGYGYKLVTPAGCPTSGLQFTSVNQAVPQERFYYRDAATGALMRAAMLVAGSVDCSLIRQFTSEEIFVDQFGIQMNGTTPGSIDGQPRITLSFRFHAKNPKPGTETGFWLQTTITQRVRDLP